MMHSLNWLEEPLWNATFRSNKGKKLIYRRSFQKQPLDSKSYSLYAAKKHIAANHDVEHAIMWYMEIHKEIHFHPSGRFIVNNDRGNFVALRLIIKKKTFIHAIISFVYISN